MRSRQLKIFYFYLNVKSRKIKKQITEKDSAEGKAFQKSLRRFLKTVGKAAIVSLLIYEVFFYLNMGRLLLPSEYMAQSLLQLETLLGFFYILSIFLIFPLISGFVNNRLNHLQPFLKILFELVLVLIFNAILLSLIHFAPLLIFFPEVEPSPDRIRTSYLVTGIFSLFFYFFVERERSKKRLQAEMLRSARLQKENFQAQLENLKDQVNPHFLFNSLNVLVSLIPLDADRATEFTRKLSKLYRSFLDNSSEQLIPLRKELDIIDAYIYLLKTRFGDSVQFEMQISSEAKELQLPPGSLQVVLENAIKHNGSTRKKPLLIKIFSEENFLLVKNNLQPRLEQLESTNTGLKNIESRYSYLSEKKPVFTKTETDFIAKLPLLKVENS
ncbi:Histidine kinase [Salinimicrobium catena]|uniref:Histidine kinase n=1 Tax=Salinimicrobium catena TaxID=390640 RepID=A0A1H5JXF5_9FLAO|nr:histidine kinase [Salinimicrobium catena]SDK91218.1 Histidine kinase [Salinimicrobium catena]SEE56937.1 Histidine kinase [Salinimicrobium catena]